MENFSPASPSVKWKIPVFLMIVLCLLFVAGGFSWSLLQQRTASSVIPPGWKVYDGGIYTFAYPPSWVLKTGFNFKADVAVYDPMTKKRWAGSAGTLIDWPLHYVDVVSVRQTTETASDTVDNYEQAWQVSDSQISRQAVIKNNLEYELYGVVGENTVIYQNVAISNGKSLALLESSLSSLSAPSIERTILETFQLKY